MTTITLTASNGTVTHHQLKTDWSEVTVAELAGWPTGGNSLRTRVRQTIAAASMLSDVPDEILRSDVSIPHAIVEASPWINKLPQGDGPLTHFTHEGVDYEHVGNLDTISAGQLEALLDFLESAGEDPAQVFHLLLAVLYTPVGTKQTTKSVEAAAEGFKRLPVTKAWPALSFFLTSSAPSALRSRQYSVAHEKAARELETMAEMVKEKEAASRSFWQRWQWKGAALWTQYARKLLTTCSPSKSFGVSGN